MSAIITGEAADEVCLSRATFLLLDNYQKDPGTFQPETQAEMALIDSYWERRTDGSLGVEKPSGFYATFYAPKGGNSCPPVLALRGTVFSDARGVALNVKIKVSSAAIDSVMREWSFAVEPSEIDIGALKAAHEAGIGLSDLREGGAVYEALNIRPIEEITGGTWIELFANRGLSTVIQRRVPILPPVGPLMRIPQDLRSIMIEMQLELWLNPDQGDWATNVLQGIGERTVQYGQELKDAVQDAVQIARNEFDGRLRIIGHSLGGGLASAAAIRARYLDSELKVYGLTYDSSGVHRTTARDLGGDLNNPDSVPPIVARSVEDEILTSMQKESDFVPFASSAIRFTGNKMPPALGALAEKKGVSPGPIGNKRAPDGTIINGHEFATKWGRMPNLLPIEDQNLIAPRNGEPALGSIALVAGLAANARNIEGFIDNLHAEIERRVQETRAERDREEAAEERAEADRERAEAEAESAAERAEADAEAAAERAEADAEAAAERAEADAEAAAERAEAEAEANEPGGVLGALYNVYDEVRDAGVAAGRLGSDLADEAGDLGRAAIDEVGDIGRDVLDEAGDLGRGALDELGDVGDAIGDAAGDAVNFAREHTIQYLEHWVELATELYEEGAGFGSLMGAIAAYHDVELAAFTFVFGPRNGL